ncbi:MAG: PQQ-binding-like beta-propeller repeat protein [Deltaproteobacteria bacterium]|nr:PQQ-binding-like beta-propeller repeat protein [Deltaproteobacteria bacterium]
MTIPRPLIALLTVIGIALAACSSDSGPSCSLNGGTMLADSAWPKFHADALNSGRSLPGVDLSVNDGSGGILFPPAVQTIGANEATPVLGPQYIYVGSTDGNVYVIDYDGMPITLTDDMMVDGPITGTPLLGANGNLFVPTNGSLTQFNDEGEVRNSALLSGFAAASPNIWSGDGTIYVGTLQGGFNGICPNGVPRYQLNFPITQSPAALAQDPNEPTKSTPIILSAGLSGIVRAYNIRGRQRWSFFASATISAAVLIDPTTETFYVADGNGRIFAGALMNGALDSGFDFPPAGAPISASLALGRDDAEIPSLYAADQSGALYAVNRATGEVRWTFQADGPVVSSPAVAIGGTNDIIVLAADLLGTVAGSATPVPVGGRVYAIRDDGTTGTLLWSFDTGFSIGAASPAINSDGTIYIGRSGLYLESDSARCPNGLAPCQLSGGGAVYAIGPGAPTS